MPNPNNTSGSTITVTAYNTPRVLGTVFNGVSHRDPSYNGAPDHELFPITDYMTQPVGIFGKRSTDQGISVVGVNSGGTLKFDISDPHKLHMPSGARATTAHTTCVVTVTTPNIENEAGVDLPGRDFTYNFAAGVVPVGLPFVRGNHLIICYVGDYVNTTLMPEALTYPPPSNLIFDVFGDVRATSQENSFELSIKSDNNNYYPSGITLRKNLPEKDAEDQRQSLEIKGYARRPGLYRITLHMKSEPGTRQSAAMGNPIFGAENVPENFFIYIRPRYPQVGDLFVVSPKLSAPSTSTDVYRISSIHPKGDFDFLAGFINMYTKRYKMDEVPGSFAYHDGVWDEPVKDGQDRTGYTHISGGYWVADITPPTDAVRSEDPDSLVLCRDEGNYWRLYFSSGNANQVGRIGWQPLAAVVRPPFEEFLTSGGITKHGNNTSGGALLKELPPYYFAPIEAAAIPLKLCAKGTQPYFVFNNNEVMGVFSPAAVYENIIIYSQEPLCNGWPTPLCSGGSYGATNTSGGDSYYLTKDGIKYDSNLLLWKTSGGATWAMCSGGDFSTKFPVGDSKYRNVTAVNRMPTALAYCPPKPINHCHGGDASISTRDIVLGNLPEVDTEDDTAKPKLDFSTSISNYEHVSQLYTDGNQAAPFTVVGTSPGAEGSVVWDITAGSVRVTTIKYTVVCYDANGMVITKEMHDDGVVTARRELQAAGTTYAGYDYNTGVKAEGTDRKANWGKPIPASSDGAYIDKKLSIETTTLTKLGVLTLAVEYDNTRYSVTNDGTEDVVVNIREVLEDTLDVEKYNNGDYDFSDDSLVTKMLTASATIAFIELDSPDVGKWTWAAKGGCFEGAPGAGLAGYTWIGSYSLLRFINFYTTTMYYDFDGQYDNSIKTVSKSVVSTVEGGTEFPSDPAAYYSKSPSGEITLHAGYSRSEVSMQSTDSHEYKVEAAVHGSGSVVGWTGNQGYFRADGIKGDITGSVDLTSAYALTSAKVSETTSGSLLYTGAWKPEKIRLKLSDTFNYDVSTHPNAVTIPKHTMVALTDTVQYDWTASGGGVCKYTDEYVTIYDPDGSVVGTGGGGGDSSGGSVPPLTGNVSLQKTYYELTRGNAYVKAPQIRLKDGAARYDRKRYYLKKGEVKYYSRPYALDHGTVTVSEEVSVWELDSNEGYMVSDTGHYVDCGGEYIVDQPKTSTPYTFNNPQVNPETGIITVTVSVGGVSETFSGPSPLTIEFPYHYQPPIDECEGCGGARGCFDNASVAREAIIGIITAKQVPSVVKYTYTYNKNTGVWDAEAGAPIITINATTAAATGATTLTVVYNGRTWRGTGTPTANVRTPGAGYPKVDGSATGAQQTIQVGRHWCDGTIDGGGNISEVWNSSGGGYTNTPSVAVYAGGSMDMTVCPANYTPTCGIHKPGIRSISDTSSWIGGDSIASRVEFSAQAGSKLWYDTYNYNTTGKVWEQTKVTANLFTAEPSATPDGGDLILTVYPDAYPSGGQITSSATYPQTTVNIAKTFTSGRDTNEVTATAVGDAIMNTVDSWTYLNGGWVLDRGTGDLMEQPDAFVTGGGVVSLTLMVNEVEYSDDGNNAVTIDRKATNENPLEIYGYISATKRTPTATYTYTPGSSGGVWKLSPDNPPYDDPAFDQEPSIEIVKNVIPVNVELEAYAGGSTYTARGNPAIIHKEWVNSGATYLLQGEGQYAGGSGSGGGSSGGGKQTYEKMSSESEGSGACLDWLFNCTLGPGGCIDYSYTKLAGSGGEAVSGSVVPGKDAKSVEFNTTFTPFIGDEAGGGNQAGHNYKAEVSYEARYGGIIPVSGSFLVNELVPVTPPVQEGVPNCGHVFANVLAWVANREEETVNSTSDIKFNKTTGVDEAKTWWSLNAVVSDAPPRPDDGTHGYNGSGARTVYLTAAGAGNAAGGIGLSAMTANVTSNRAAITTTQVLAPTMDQDENIIGYGLAKTVYTEPTTPYEAQEDAGKMNGMFNISFECNGGVEQIPKNILYSSGAAAGNNVQPPYVSVTGSRRNETNVSVGAAYSYTATSSAGIRTAGELNKHEVTATGYDTGLGAGDFDNSSKISDTDTTANVTEPGDATGGGWEGDEHKPITQTAEYSSESNISDSKCKARITVGLNLKYSCNNTQ